MNIDKSIRIIGHFSRPFIWAFQTVIFTVSGVAAFFLRFDFNVPADELMHMAYAVPVWILVKSIVFRIARLERGLWRYVSIYDVVRLGIGNLLGSVIAGVVIWWIGPAGFPRSIYLLDLLLCFLATAGMRMTARIVSEAPTFNRVRPERKRTAIYGAGDAGVALLQELRHSPNLPYEVVGFVDDNPRKAKLTVYGTKVLCNGDNLPLNATKHGIEMVLIALPSASGTELTQVLRRCHEAGLPYKTIPSIGEIIAGNGLANHIRSVAVEDLLGRKPVRLEELAIQKTLLGRSVMITGAGGSIGSELCRQIARYRPSAIVVFDIAETALFELESEMRERFPGVSLFCEIGSVQNAQRLREVLEQHQPCILYHAAAYKHVPMMESHIFEAMENNVFGTYTVAAVAGEYGIEDFVMISTDKAVRPTSVMGVTKRLAELLVNSLQNGKTRFVSVRFGNVLGSNGSVIPLFKRQIAAGGPVTVTHPEMQRYFMTIPEAVQLVLQASTMGQGGEIFVLDMGAPVKIVDLAKNLILLSGLRPNEDIQITFTGVRPGEKLYEELRVYGESTAPTCHEKIKTFTGLTLNYGEMREHIEALRRICAARDVTQLVLRLKEIVPDYNPSAYILRRALERQNVANAVRIRSAAVG